MSKNVITARYAKAMLSGLSGTHLEDLKSDIKSLLELIEKTELKQVLVSPLLSKVTLKNVFDALFKQAKPHLRLQGLCYTLVDNRRTQNLVDTLTMALHLITQQSGEMEATVTSAKALSDAEQKALTEALSTKTGKKIRISTKTDADLLGGVVVQLGSLQIDDSVKTKLTRLRRALAGKAA